MILLIDQSASVLREAAQLDEEWSVKEIIPASQFKVSNLSNNTFCDVRRCLLVERGWGVYVHLCVLIRVCLCLLSGLPLRLHLSLCY